MDAVRHTSVRAVFRLNTMVWANNAEKRTNANGAAGAGLNSVQQCLVCDEARLGPLEAQQRLLESASHLLCMPRQEAISAS